MRVDQFQHVCEQEAIVSGSKEPASGTVLFITTENGAVIIRRFRSLTEAGQHLIGIDGRLI